MRILLFLVRTLLSLRYRVRIRGLEKIGGDDGHGRLFLPNHPALIDPVILLAWLWPRYRLRALADARQVDRPVVGWLARRLGVVRIPDASKDGAAAGPAVGLALDELAALLDAGENVLLYPAGRLMDSREESLGAASGAAHLLESRPSAIPVAVRTRGLWGSAFSRADGVEPDIARILWRGFWRTLASGIFFLPRRDVDIDLVEAYELPRGQGRLAVNQWLENWHNREAPPRLYVPRSRWEKGGLRVLPDLPPGQRAGGLRPDEVPEEIRALAHKRLRELSGVEDPSDPALRLAGDLGLDSLAVGALAIGLAQELDVPVAAPDRLVTVADVYAAALGRLPAAGSGRAGKSTGGQNADDGSGASTRTPVAWLRGAKRAAAPLAVRGSTLPDAFLSVVRRDPKRPLFMDGEAVKTARETLAAIHALAPAIAALPAGPDGRVGLMLPAGGAALAAYYATLWAGRAPVLFNWSLGAAGVARGAEALDVRAIVTAGPLVARLEAMGMDYSACRERLVMLDRLAAGIGRLAKLRAFWRALCRKGPLAPVSETAAVLFTSGSEATPKIVPLTHANLLANLRDVLVVAGLRRGDVLLAMLPPFHSFGLLVGLAAPGAAGLRVAYHPSPLEGPALAALVERSRATLLVGTPTFVDGIARAASPGALASVRLAVTGAEACGGALRAALREKAPGAAVIEGYGITECSPILSLDDPRAPTPGSIGRPLASVAWMLVDPDDPTRKVDGADAPGQLLVRGPSIFGGYASPRGAAAPDGAVDKNNSTDVVGTVGSVESVGAVGIAGGEGGGAPQGFRMFGGRRWFDTGDLIRVVDGRWHFAGRRRRFVKMGGEMVSLPAVEAVLERAFPPAPPPGAAEDAGPRPRVAVVAVAEDSGAESAGERSSLWAAATPDTSLTREEANRLIREAGLSVLHGLKGVATVAEIPLLATGKIDHRALTATVAGALS